MKLCGKSVYSFFLNIIIQSQKLGAFSMLPNRKNVEKKHSVSDIQVEIKGFGIV